MIFINLHEKSIKVIKNDQTRFGSFVHGPNFAAYKYCWIRDGTFIAYALDLVGESKAAAKFHSWVNNIVNRYSYKVHRVIKKNREDNEIFPDEYLHCRFNLNGTESKTRWSNFQLDSYGEWIWGLAQHIRITGNENLIDEYSDSISMLVEYLLEFWQEPCYDCWEEYEMKIHTSTLAAIYGGLKAINKYLESEKIKERIKSIKEFLQKRCVYNKKFVKYLGSKRVDANLIWLSTPFKVFNHDSDLMKNTIRKIELGLVSKNGGCRRYPGDTYYGGEWIITTAFLGWYYRNIGETNKAQGCLKWIEKQADKNFLLPEQVNIREWIYYEIWKKRWGDIPKPLLWSHAMYLILENHLTK